MHFRFTQIHFSGNYFHAIQPDNTSILFLKQASLVWNFQDRLSTTDADVATAWFS